MSYNVFSLNLNVYARNWSFLGFHILCNDWNSFERFNSHCSYRIKSGILHSNRTWHVWNGWIDFTSCRLLLLIINILLYRTFDGCSGSCLLLFGNSWKIQTVLGKLTFIKWKFWRLNKKNFSKSKQTNTLIRIWSTKKKHSHYLA